MIHRGLHLNVFLLTEAQTLTLATQTVRTVPNLQKTTPTKLGSVAAYNGVAPKAKKVKR
jgi:hypothetical protein